MLWNRCNFSLLLKAAETQLDARDFLSWNHYWRMYGFSYRHFSFLKSVLIRVVTGVVRSDTCRDVYENVDWRNTLINHNMPIALWFVTKCLSMVLLWKLIVCLCLFIFFSFCVWRSKGKRNTQKICLNHFSFFFFSFF